MKTKEKSLTRNWELIHLAPKGDGQGKLIAIQQKVDVPFKIKRAYFIYNTLEGIHRGFHAHKNLSQILIAVSGSCEVIVDNGNTQEKYKLNKPTKGLVIHNLIWREMYNFSSDCVLLVLANEYYTPDDYIRDYDQFLSLSESI